MTTATVWTSTYEADDGVDFAAELDRQGFIDLSQADPEQEFDGTLRILPSDVDSLVSLLQRAKVAATVSSRADL